MTLHEAIEALAALNDAPGLGGITREVYTPTYRRGLDEVVIPQMEAAGLTTRFDAFGNLIGRWEGTEPDAPLVLTGSHVDTTLNAGKYDGVLGVLGAVAAVERLRSHGVTPRRSIEVIAFAGEEPRFGTGCIGSRALAGDLSRADLDRLQDRDGVTLAQALDAAGFPPDAVPDAKLDPERIHAFVELHIEQGIVLETGGEEIGVVTAIAAPHDFRLTIEGAATHAGATPMRLRHDALAGAAELMLTLEALAAGSSSGTTVGTVGVLRLAPGAINVVPGTVQLDVDIRDVNLGVRDEVVANTITAGEAITSRRGLTLSFEEIVRDVPAPCATVVVDAVQAACDELGVRSRRMHSGAYHDAMVLARIVPIGMVFVPSVGGVSHHPDEYTAPEDLDRGVAVLAGTLRRLSR